LIILLILDILGNYYSYYIYNF